MKHHLILRTFLALALTGCVSRVAFAQTPPPTPPVQQPPAPTTPVLTPTQQTAAQQAAQQATGRQVSNEQISNAIRQSGLSQAEIQARLRSGGYDPSLSDPFFSGGGRGGAGEGSGQATSGNSAFADALQRLGILNTPFETGTAETTVRSLDVPSGRAGGVFGKEVFSRAATVFDPVLSGPVDPTYRLGIGDQMQLVVTGQVELAYQLELRRDGTVIIPQVGQLSLAGLTLDAARTVLKDRMGRSYSGLNNGEARLDLTISKIRSNAVFVIGEVEAPGAYQVNALATVFHALARSGGPTITGSFRNVEVRRGGRVVQRLDLYDYLLRGDASADIRLEQGDQIYVPLSRRNVAVMGQVRRPRVFELREAEGFGDLLAFAGGLTTLASVERVQIDRVVPPDQRRPGFERVAVDIEIRGRLDSLARVPLLDGDLVQVFGIGDVRRNVVSLSGQVFKVGQYELKPGMTLGRLIDEAQGFLPWALPARVKIVRGLPLTGHRELIDVDATMPSGRAFVLAEFDGVEVLDARTAYPGGTVSIEGAINRAGTRDFLENESLRDAIERSGGLREEAQTIEVYRRRLGATYSDTTSIRFAFPITQSFASDSSVTRFKLSREDRVVVRASPGFRSQQFANVSGLFKYSGTFAITENQDRISDLVQRAGGTLPTAYPTSFSLTRSGTPVALDFERAMRGDINHNFLLRAGDVLSIGPDPKTVLVSGAVARPTLVRFQSGLGVNDYIELAGGPAENGNPGRAVVSYPSGYSRRVKPVAIFFHSSPDVVSGATITVPVKPESNVNVGEVINRMFQVASTLATIVIAYKAVSP